MKTNGNFMMTPEEELMLEKEREPVPIIYTNVIFPNDGYDRICWCWEILNSNGVFIYRNSGHFEAGEFGRHKESLSLVPIIRALSWAYKEKLSNIVIRSDNRLVVEQINRASEAPKNCSDTYMGMLRQVRGDLKEIGGQVAWAPEKIETNHSFTEWIKSDLPESKDPNVVWMDF